MVSSSESPYKVFVFDLDFTLWDCGGTWCDCTTPPYSHNADGSVSDSYGRTITTYPDVFDILEWLKAKDLKIALASRTDAPSWANQLTKLLRIDPYIDHREIYPGSKTTHLTKISKAFEAACSEIIFFDDEYRNIAETTPMGVRAIHVPAGLNRALFERTALKQTTDSTY